MRRIKKGANLARLLALALTLSLLLAGCGGGAADVPTPSPEIPSESPDESADSPEEPEEPEETEATPSESEGRLSRMGLVKGELDPLTEEEARAIMGAVAEMERSYAVGADGKDPLIQDHDWGAYSSDLGKEPLSRAELELYDRLDRVAMKYLSQSNLDGERSGKSSSYKMAGVQYSDLGLSADQAFDLLIWFEYNNPQYYFLSCSCSYTRDTIFPFIYEFAADGEKRAEITNDLFEKLYRWVQTVGSRAANTYQKELYASNLICESVTYDKEALGKSDRAKEILNLCQSLYSVVIRENTVCAGYSKAFCAIMNALGVDATAGLSTSHAWNVVRFDDGNYYCVDVCWNDTDQSPPYDNDYINVGDKDSKAGDNGRECHIYEDCYAGWIPALAAESYVPTEEDLSAEVLKLSAPQNVAVTEAADALNFTWNPVPNASGYVIARFDNPEYAGTPVRSYDVSKPEYTYLKAQGDAAQTLQPGTTYYFGVRAYQASGSVYSDWTYLSVTTKEEDSAPAPAQLAAPTNIRPMSLYISNTSAMIAWDKVSGATGYEVNIYEDAEHSGEPQTFQISTGNTCSFYPLEIGTTYYLTVRAVKEENGQTIYSDWADYSYTHEKPSPPPWRA